MKQIAEQVKHDSINELPAEAPSAQIVALNPNRESSAVLAAITGMMDRGINAEAAEKWMALWDKVEAKEAARQFHEALAKVQSQIPSIGKNGDIKDKSNRVVSTYSTYEDIMLAVKPLLDQYGMTFTCLTGRTENNLVPVTGVLGHIGGHTMQATLELPADPSGFKNAVQGTGSSLSYSRRYLAILMLNIVSADIDDDGVAAGQIKDPEPAAQQNHALISPAQIERMRSLLAALGEGAEAKLLEKCKIARLEDLAADRVIGAFKYVEEKVAQHTRAQKKGAPK